ncbi:MAG: hypothetical protein K0B11_13570 [Mariniphaga sp.]|nr:hypothetical protein [Mariniphaga sp.]
MENKSLILIPRVLPVKVKRYFGQSITLLWFEYHVVFFCIQFQPVTFLKPASFMADKIRAPGL